MTLSSTTSAWDSYYQNLPTAKPQIPESFVARIFLSHRPVKILKNYDFSGKKILDVGAGQGRHIPLFKSLGFEVSATEVGQSALDQIRKTFPDVDLHQCLSNNLVFDSDTFDFSIAVNSIYYIESVDDLVQDNLKELLRVLKPGGVLICSFIGPEHFILNDAKILENHNAVITSNDHQCQTDTVIRPVSSKNEIESLFSDVDNVQITMIGEIRDELLGMTRHLFYVIAEKRS